MSTEKHFLLGNLEIILYQGLIAQFAEQKNVTYKMMQQYAVKATKDVLIDVVRRDIVTQMAAEVCEVEIEVSIHH